MPRHLRGATAAEGDRGTVPRSNAPVQPAHAGASGAATADRPPPASASASGALPLSRSRAARPRATSAEMCTAAEVRGGSKDQPDAAEQLPPAIVTIRTASGWIPSAAPNASACTSCWSAPLANRTTMVIASAVPVPWRRLPSRRGAFLGYPSRGGVEGRTDSRDCCVGPAAPSGVAWVFPTCSRSAYRGRDNSIQPDRTSALQSQSPANPALLIRWRWPEPTVPRDDER